MPLYEMEPLLEARAKVARLTDAYLSPLPPGEERMPMVPFIAKDALSVEVLEFYLRRLRSVRPQRPEGYHSAQPIEAQVSALLAEFYRWQSIHPDQVKLPD